MAQTIWAGHMAEPSDSIALSNLLLCHESESSLNLDEERIERSEQVPHFPPPTTIDDDDDDYVAELVRKENRRFETEEPTKTSSSSVDRLIAIDWILTTRTRFGFQHQTAYIAISYLDLFLHKRFIGLQKDESWAIRLLSVACLSLAAKMEERTVPGLSQYPQDHDFVFKPDVIRKTELLILSTLDWKLNLITPFHYFNYFLSTISPLDKNNNQSVSKDLVLLRSSESLLALTKEVSFTEYRQFAVAAATTMLASSTSSDIIRLTREEMANKFGSISWWTSNDNENVYLCYQRMLEIEDRKHMTPPPETSVLRDIQPPSSGSGAKRRLSFDDSDQTSAAKRMRRL
ncbi:PREDICTED: cyclin-D5-1-like [Camelina sativa]|uniref:Cyclin-D5-1-like n=1 Tax=Camelina sativa TaxID=90675 RepID=A0ABM1QQG1_CAMSA|nr:PREDICTED: cyclin-D5-1-like [Camelina sativa]